MLHRVNQPPQFLRKEKIMSITPESNVGTLLGTLVDPNILIDLQAAIIAEDISYLGIIYMLMCYLDGNSEIKTGIISHTNPGVLQKIDIDSAIIFAIKENPDLVSQATLNLGKLYQTPESFYMLKKFGDMIHLNPAVQEKTRQQVESLTVN